MKRDMDLIRRILLAVEAHPDAAMEYAPEFEDVSEDAVNYHVKLLYCAGLLDGLHDETNDGETWLQVEVTWAGHEFLNVSRDDTQWNDAKRKLGDKIASVPFDVLNGVLVALAKSQLGAVLGVQL